MSDNYTPSTDEVRAVWCNVEVGNGAAFDRTIESVRTEERERIARNIEAQIDPQGPDFSVWNTAARRAARIVREGA